MTILVQQLRAEIEQLRAQLEMTNKHGESLQQIGNALRLGAGSDLHTTCVPEIVALRRDAERYRWLRNSAPSRLATGPVVAMAEADGSVLARDGGHAMLLGREDADAAIDQAMTKEQP